MAELNLMEVLAKEPADMTAEELNFIISYQAKLTAAKKVAKEKGVITSKVKVEKSPELQLLSTAFEAVITANLDFIKTLYPVSAEKPMGAKGVTVGTPESCPFYIQILNKAAFKHDAEENKKAKEAKKAAEKPAEEAKTL